MVHCDSKPLNLLSIKFTVWLIILSSIIADVEESEEEIESESLIFMLFTCVGDLFSNREIHHSRSVALQT